MDYDSLPEISSSPLVPISALGALALSGLTLAAVMKQGKELKRVGQEFHQPASQLKEGLSKVQSGVNAIGRVAEFTKQ